MLGTWTSEDPDGYVNGMDDFQAFRGRPAGQVDPTGLYTETLDGIAGIRWNDNDKVAEVGFQMSSVPSWFDKWIPGVGYFGTQLEKPNWVEWVPLRSLPQEFASPAGLARLVRLCTTQNNTQEQDVSQIRDALAKDLCDQVNSKTLRMAGHEAAGVTGLGPTGEGLLLAAGLTIVGGALKAIGDASAAGGAGRASKVTLDMSRGLEPGSAGIIRDGPDGTTIVTANRGVSHGELDQALGGAGSGTKSLRFGFNARTQVSYITVGPTGDVISDAVEAKALVEKMSGEGLAFDPKGFVSTAKNGSIPLKNLLP